MWRRLVARLALGILLTVVLLHALAHAVPVTEGMDLGPGRWQYRQEYFGARGVLYGTYTLTRVTASLTLTLLSVGLALTLLSGARRRGGAGLYCPSHDRGAAGVVVAVAESTAYERKAMMQAVRQMLDRLEPRLPSLVRHGDRVIVKVNMGCGGARRPEERYTSHPLYVEAILEALLDCGARVGFGDDVSRKPVYERIWQLTGMADVAKRTGARLVDFMAAGGREIRGRLWYPRTHLISNAVLDADVVVNAASCRSLSPVVMSGAIKNMFGALLGDRRLRIHGMFPDIRRLSRAIVDVFSVARPHVSFLDLTSVVEGQGVAPQVRPVGLILGGVDAVAVDTVAQHAVGYEGLTLWTNVFGNAVGLGCNAMEHIRLEGASGDRLSKTRLRYPAAPSEVGGSLYDGITRALSHTLLRPRPVVKEERCTSCGDCAKRCPVDAIAPTAPGYFGIDHRRCGDCGACLKVCEAGAIQSEMFGLAKLARRVAHGGARGASGSTEMAGRSTSS